ncbi:MAG: hypothetical protein GDA51_03915 [Ekhidna sp.]|nr:hypothetical protein [Ekhidna sp.]
MLRQSRKDCYDAIIVILNLQGFQNLEGFSNIIHQQELPFFHQNTSASVSESCGRVERSLPGSLANVIQILSESYGIK